MEGFRNKLIGIWYVTECHTFQILVHSSTFPGTGTTYTGRKSNTQSCLKICGNRLCIPPPSAASSTSMAHIHLHHLTRFLLCPDTGQSSWDELHPPACTSDKQAVRCYFSAELQYEEIQLVLAEWISLPFHAANPSFVILLKRNEGHPSGMQWFPSYWGVQGPLLVVQRP